MADIINLLADSGRNIISDDATATLELENNSTGSSLKLKGDPTTSPVLELINRGVAGTATIAMVKVAASAASTPAFEFAGSVVVSTASGTASLMGAVRAKLTLPDGTIGYGWIPIMHKVA